MSDARRLLRLHLLQRAELGETELVLGTAAAAALRAALRPPSVAPAPPTRPDGARRAGAAALREAAAAAGAPPSPPTAPRPAAPARVPVREITDAQIAAPSTLDALAELAAGCGRCALAGSRRQVVFGEGPVDAEVMVVGEAPGADEDRLGRPFVGRAGKLLDLMLCAAGLERERVYVCNVLKCRPPANRNPEPAEVAACAPYLLRQVEAVSPRVVVAFGTFAAQTLLATDTPVGRLRGRTHDYRGVPLVPTYHPAACLRHPAWVRAVWEDLQRVRAVLDAP
jgi:uracil-DNA glycosylase